MYIRPVVMHRVACYILEKQKCLTACTRILLACYAVRESLCFPELPGASRARNSRETEELILSTFSRNLLLSLHRHADRDRSTDEARPAWNLASHVLKYRSRKKLEILLWLL